MTDQAPGVAPSAVPKVSDGYRRYAMTVLLIIYILNFVDRQVINILAEPIKNELGLMDWQLGMLTGLAFAVLYTMLGLPIARLAERRHRPAIIGISLAVWSVFTAVCGLAQNFAQLILARVGVGVGEAGCTPAAHSLIADYVPREERASAIAFYSMGTPLGSLVGLAIGGMIADAYGWRMAFIVCGLPGLVFALIAGFTLIEPRLKSVGAAAAAQGATYREVVAELFRKRTFWHLAVGTSVVAFIGYGHAPFIASFFFRVHAAELAALAAPFGLKAGGFLGIALGLGTGLGGAIGAFIGGQLADRLGKRDIRHWMAVPSLGAVAAIPLYAATLWAPSAVMALGLLSLATLTASLWYGPIYATAQSISPIRTRATASAVLLFIVNLIGLGLGPLLVGALSDFCAISLGLGKGEGVRWALLISASLGVIACAAFWTARKVIKQDMED
jgi:MFS family permease